MLSKFFQDLDFDITVDIDKKKVVIYLNVEFKLSAGTVSSYTKPKTVLKYADFKSTHPLNIIKHIPKGIEFRLSRDSSSEGIFELKRI